MAGCLSGSAPVKPLPVFECARTFILSTGHFDWQVRLLACEVASKLSAARKQLGRTIR